MLHFQYCHLQYQIFLGTPHTKGSDIARTLGNLFSLTYGRPISDQDIHSMERGFQHLKFKESKFDTVTDHATWQIICAYEEYGSPEV